MFCQRLRDKCPNNMDMWHVGRWIVRALLLHTPPSTDLSDRSNAQLRKDLTSTAGSKSPVASANRVMCRSAARYHESIGGARAPCAQALLDAQRSAEHLAPSGQSPSGSVDDPLVGWEPREAPPQTNEQCGSVLIAMSNKEREVGNKDVRAGPPDSACCCRSSCDIMLFTSMFSWLHIKSCYR